MGEDENNIQVPETFTYSYDDKFNLEDVANRRIYLNCEINNTIIDNAVYHILRYNGLDKGVVVEERVPIIIYINSIGGNFSDGFSLIDTIRLSQTPVYTVNVGACCSMALLIFMAGQKRYSLPHSQFLLHEGQIQGFGGSTSKVKEAVEFETKQIEEMTKKFILERSKISNRKYNANYKKEWYFLPQEGKQIGIVDYIVGEDCDLDEIL